MTRRSVNPTFGAVGIALVVLITLLFVASRSTLWDRDEPRYARAAVEMVESGDHLVPSFNGEPRLGKPILIYWLMSVPIRLLGPTELACRLVSPVAMALTCVLVYWIGRRLFDAAEALAATAIVATNPLVMVVGTAATTDAVLLACIVASMAIFLNGFGKTPSWGSVLALAVALGLAQLAKGPVGLVVPLLAIATTLWFVRAQHRSRAWAPSLVCPPASC